MAAALYSMAWGTWGEIAPSTYLFATSTLPAMSSTMETAPSYPSSTVLWQSTVVYSCLPTMSSTSAFTPVTIPPAPPASVLFVTVWTTQYTDICPTGLTTKTYTITESCTGDQSAYTTPIIPPGFTTTTKVCTPCAGQPTLTVTELISDNGTTGGITYNPGNINPNQNVNNNPANTNPNNGINENKNQNVSPPPAVNPPVVPPVVNNPAVDIPDTQNPSPAPNSPAQTPKPDSNANSNAATQQNGVQGSKTSALTSTSTVLPIQITGKAGRKSVGVGKMAVLVAVGVLGVFGVWM